MYLVLDTSVILQAFFKPDGYAANLVRLAREADFLLCGSEAILQEIEEKLLGFGANALDVRDFITLYREIAVICGKKTFTQQQIDDDDHIVGCVQECDGQLVITNDKPLIKKLKKLGIAAIRPSQFQTYFPKNDQL